MNRLMCLDGLRGIAAMAVVIFHYTYYYNNIYGHDIDVSPLLILARYGVHLFFMISGFVIFWTISRVNNPLDFIASRFARLYPTFWFAVTVTFLVVCAVSLPDRVVSFETYLANLTMFHEYASYGHVDGVYWTLTLELAFYFWILVIYCLRQLGNIEKILIVWVLVVNALPFIDADLYAGGNWKLNRLLIWDYIEFFAAGICFYKYHTRTHTVFTHVLLAMTVLAIWLGRNPVIAVFLWGFYLVFYGAISGRIAILTSKPLVYLGTISYSLYLIHQNIGYAIIMEFYNRSWSPYVGILVAMVFSLVAAHCMSKYIERPGARFIKRKYASW